MSWPKAYYQVPWTNMLVERDQLSIYVDENFNRLQSVDWADVEDVIDWKTIEEINEEKRYPSDEKKEEVKIKKALDSFKPIKVAVVPNVQKADVVENIDSTEPSIFDWLPMSFSEMRLLLVEKWVKWVNLMKEESLVKKCKEYGIF
jgi:hypothetical protein